MIPLNSGSAELSGAVIPLQHRHRACYRDFIPLLELQMRISMPSVEKTMSLHLSFEISLYRRNARRVIAAKRTSLRGPCALPAPLACLSLLVSFLFKLSLQPGKCGPDKSAFGNGGGKPDIHLQPQLLITQVLQVECEVHFSCWQYSNLLCPSPAALEGVQVLPHCAVSPAAEDRFCQGIGQAL